MFRDAFRRHRCLIVADGSYEWKNDERRSTPFFISIQMAFEQVMSERISH